MPYFNSYLITRIFRSIASIVFLLSFFNSIGQNQVILHGIDKDIALINVITGDKYYDSGGPGGSKLPDQPGNYKNCDDPFNENANCTSVFTFCSATNDSVCINFTEFHIVTGDRMRIYSGKFVSGPTLFDSQNQGVSLNGMKLTTGTLLKSKASDGCITVQWFCTTIGNSIGWEADFIVHKKSDSVSVCTPQCNGNLILEIPVDTCYRIPSLSKFASNVSSACNYQLNLFYPPNTDVFKNHAVNHSHVGKTFLYEVKDSASKNSCFGYVTVRESAALSFCVNDTVSCLEYDQNLKKIHRATNCAQVSALIKSSVFYALDCSQLYIGYIVRNIELSDTSKLVTVCSDTIYIEKFKLDSTVYPSDIKLTCSLVNNTSPFALTPEYLFNHFDLNKDNVIDHTAGRIYPSYNGIILKDSDGICITRITYSDVIIPGCGAGYKIRRQWSIKSGCLGKDSIFIQNVQVEDITPPLVAELKNLHLQAGSQCIASFALDTILVEDCSKVNQRVEISYPDPSQPGKTIVINGSIPLHLNLSPGGYLANYSFFDECFNVTRQNICILIEGNVQPATQIKSVAEAYLDSATCTSKINAVDYVRADSSNHCCTSIYSLIAVKDSVDYYKAKLLNQVNAFCQTNAGYNANKSYYDVLIDRWLTANVFQESVDIPHCGNTNLVIRSFANCNLYSQPKNFTCSAHDWFNYLTIPEFRSTVNQSPSCHPLFSLHCIDQYMGSYSDTSFNFNYSLPSWLNDSNSCSGMYWRQTFSRYADEFSSTEINMTVKDTISPMFNSLPEIILYVDANKRIPSTACCNNNCSGDVYQIGQWPGKFGGNNNQNFSRYYGGPFHPGAIYDSSGYHYPDCISPNEVIYCKSWLEDDTLQTKAFSVDSFFYKPVWNKAPGKNEFTIQKKCNAGWRVDSRDSLASDSCHQKIIVRKWALSATCRPDIISLTQKLIIKPLSEFEVVFPSDLTLDCNLNNSQNDSIKNVLIGLPSIKNQYPELIHISYQDSFSTNGLISECSLLYRIWTVTEPCAVNMKYNTKEIIVNDSLVADIRDRFCIFRALKDGGDGIMKYTQIIHFKDTIKPNLQLHDTTITANSNCTSDVFIVPVDVDDNCTLKDLISTDFKLDLNSDGTIDLQDGFKFGKILFLNPLPVGIHRLKTYAVDFCGNRDSSVSKLIISNREPPRAVCPPAPVQIGIPIQGKILVLSKDFDGGSSNSCQGKLSYSFSANINDSSRVYSCDSIGTKSITLYVTNSGGSNSACHINVQVVALTGACTQAVDQSTTAGSIKTPQSLGINNVTIITNQFNKSTISNSEGNYVLSQITNGTNLTIQPEKNTDPLNGVSTIDLLLIEKHIKGLSTFTDPYTLIAADVNKSGSVSVADLVDLRKLILGITSEFPNNTSWLFTPAAYRFADNANPWSFPEIIEYKPVVVSADNADFIGIKVGDVNGTASPGANTLEKRNIETIRLISKPNPMTQKFDFFLNQPGDPVQAFQIFIHNRDLIHEIDSRYEIFSNVIHSHDARLSFTSTSGLRFTDDQPLFSIKSGSADFLLDGVNSFLYSDSKIFNLNLQNETNYQIKAYPNPSQSQIQIEFVLPNNNLKYSVCLVNILGQKCNLEFPALKQGMNHILLNKSDLGGAGAYYFILKNDTLMIKKYFTIL